MKPPQKHRESAKTFGPHESERELGLHPARVRGWVLSAVAEADRCPVLETGPANSGTRGGRSKRRRIDLDEPSSRDAMGSAFLVVVTADRRYPRPSPLHRRTPICRAQSFERSGRASSSDEQQIPVELLAYGQSNVAGKTVTLALLRPTSAKERISGRVVPVPLNSKSEVDLVASCVAGASSPAVSMIDAAATLYQTKELYDGLPWKDDRKPNALASVYADAATGRLRTSLDVLERMVTSAACKVVSCGLQEVESLSPAPVLSGKLVLRREMAKIMGQVVYSPVQSELDCLPGEAISLTRKMEVPLLLPRWVWNSYAARLASDASAKSIDFADEVEFVSADQDVDDRDADGHESQAPEELTKTQVLSMSVPELRAALRKVEIKSMTTTPRATLIDLLLPWLDETVRYEIRIGEAVRTEDYAEAAQLRNNRSERSVLKEQLEDAVRDERYGEAKRIKERLDRLTELRADPTQDEGSYDPYLDQDEWYKPVG